MLGMNRVSTLASLYVFYLFVELKHVTVETEKDV